MVQVADVRPLLCVGRENTSDTPLDPSPGPKNMKGDSIYIHIIGNELQIIANLSKIIKFSRDSDDFLQQCHFGLKLLILIED